MESELYEAAVKGNVDSLLELLVKDKLLLDRIMTGNRTETPLHIAAMLGYLEFVEEVLARKPELAREQDSQSSTPLHLAAAKGYLNIVASLLRVSPEICFVRDKYERNPLHVAAMKGRVDTLECLVRARPDAARSVVDNGQTILHLCVKHNRLEALKLLIDIMGDDQFINSTDEYGDTILHLAAADRQAKCGHNRSGVMVTSRSRAMATNRSGVWPSSSQIWRHWPWTNKDNGELSVRSPLTEPSMKTVNFHIWSSSIAASLDNKVYGDGGGKHW
ncbi:hypothetical protein NL676_036064 [Syzygium grande]|nr:hypothetical protein NL676_036064 [Syzygium grande]